MTPRDKHRRAASLRRRARAKGLAATPVVSAAAAGSFASHSAPAEDGESFDELLGELTPNADRGVRRG